MVSFYCFLFVCFSFSPRRRLKVTVCPKHPRLNNLWKSCQTEGLFQVPSLSSDANTVAPAEEISGRPNPCIVQSAQSKLYSPPPSSLLSGKHSKCKLALSLTPSHSNVQKNHICEAICAANPGYFRANGYAPTGSHGAGFHPIIFQCWKLSGFHAVVRSMV